MSTITVTIEGLDEAKRRINLLSPKLKDSIRGGIIQSLTELSHISNLLLESRTKGVGEERYKGISQSWSNPIISSHGNTIMGSLYNYSGHWRAVEYGTADRADGQDSEMTTTMDRIYPIGENPLRFKYLGHWYSKWEVHGQEPKAFIRGTIPFAKDLVKQYVKMRIESNLGGL